MSDRERVRGKRKYLPGCKKRKIAEERQRDKQKQQGALLKHVIKTVKSSAINSQQPSTSSPSTSATNELSKERQEPSVTKESAARVQDETARQEIVDPDMPERVDRGEVATSQHSEPGTCSSDSLLQSGSKHSSRAGESSLPAATCIHTSNEPLGPLLIDAEGTKNKGVNRYDDIGTWPAMIHQHHVDHIVEAGPFRPEPDFIFPIDSQRRRFTPQHFQKTMINGELIDRTWITYSLEKDAVFCFPCKLLGNFEENCMHWHTSGTNDWNHLSQKIKDHENSHQHRVNMEKWSDLKVNLHSENSLSALFVSKMRIEKKHWKEVFDRIVSAIMFLSERNLAFRGENCKLFDEKNGNFLGLIELMSKFDPVLQEHLRRIKSHEINDHYLGPQIQNELISLLADKVIKYILQIIRKCKYYSIILDCTPDASRKEQMTVILRVVIISGDNIEIREFFLGFIVVSSTTGLGLTEAIRNRLIEFNLDINNCRGQGYDNGSNMKGRIQGVQARILQDNPLAFYMPCACHNLNLILCDLGKCIPRAISFFGVVQSVYTLLSGSTRRWEVFCKHVTITVKKLCETRWESRIDSITAIKYQLREVCDALEEIADTTSDAATKCLSLSLVNNHLLNYEFIISLCIWHDILNAVNSVSKCLQAVNMSLDIAMLQLKGLVSFFKEYKDTGLTGAIIAANDIADELGVEKEYNKKRVGRKKRTFDYESLDEIPVTDPRELFRVQYFIPLLDHANNSAKQRLEQFTIFKTNFGFLYDIKFLKQLSTEELLQHCKDLHLLLTCSIEGTETSDIHGIELYDELNFFRHVVPLNATAVEAFKLAVKTDSYPNLVIAYRIMFTIPITVASAERSFSVLKLIKTFHRCSMTQERLDDLAVLSIEKRVLQMLDLDDIRETFATLKSRKVDFS